MQVPAFSPAGGLQRLGAALLLLVFAAVLGRQTTMGIREVPLLARESGLNAVTDYINEHTPGGSTIETYESELLFLLDRPCHFPLPD